ncbi:sodium-dependent transporter [Thorsellia anophelis]|uniref:Neurotransmitter:Na+ symporter, NSS family n=1 Tax=Thorsellia anophelis DSM 18579 TaxID=1123402 RepID=A0A1H9ZA36_9GAMM|nr:sodium-dependent transporter [Thorsellia anophelis]SES78439.1 neurotransmitter:Na+ symporter, NSS family [Thorsellia anophelis DSM 18579]
MSKENSPQFTSIFGFLMVIIGFAVGVGSLWRFPYIMGSQGGSYFLLAYTLLILIIGIPLLTAEMALGYHSKSVGSNSYKTIKPNTKWHYFGWLHIAAAIIIISYTVPVYTWILNFLYNTSIGTFKEIDQNSVQSFFENQIDTPALSIFAVINWALLFLVLKAGLQNGIEKWSKILMPMLAVIMIAIAIVGLTLPGGIEGVKFIFNLNHSEFSLSSIKEALGQAFFAIGIGMLGSMVFGSYIKGKDKPLLSLSTTICLAIIIAGILAGLMIFPLVFAYGFDPTGGPQLTFITLPLIFQNMPYGQLIGTVFYIGFYIAAFTSALAVFEAVISTLSAYMRLSRHQSMTITFLIVIITGFLSIYNQSVFDFLDTLTAGYLIVLGALFITIFTGYIWGMDNMLKAANITHPLAKMWMILSIKYISPIVIVFLFIIQV